MRVRKSFGRALVLLLALCLTVATTCVTAFAAELPYDQIELRLSDGSGGTVALILSPAQQKKLMEACYPADSTADSMTLTLSATIVDSLPAADSERLAALVGTAAPLLVVDLSLMRVVGDGDAVPLDTVTGGFDLTLRLPEKVSGSAPKVAVRTADGFALGSDLDTVQSTLTCTVSRMGSLVLLPADTQQVAAPAETPPAATGTPPAAPTPPPAPVQSPTTGGPMEEYAPQLRLGSPIAVTGVTNLPTVPASALPSQLLATSLMMTTAMVSGELDYESAQRREQEQQKADEAYAEMYDTDDPKWMGLSGDVTL